MAAPKKNEFWRLRSKHGRDRIFSSPTDLWNEAAKYFQETDKREWIQKDFKGKDAIEVEIPTSPPYTLTGLCLFLGVNTKYFHDFEKSIAGREDAQSVDFSEVITRIKDIIYTQKFEGAVVGAYNANIIARDLGLVDQVNQRIDHTTKGRAFDTSNLTKAEKEKLMEAIRSNKKGRE